MQPCWLKGSEDDTLHAVLSAAGFNIRWLRRALLRQLKAAGLKHVFRLAGLLRGLALGLDELLRRSGGATARIRLAR